jgi:hypothetical protein
LRTPITGIRGQLEVALFTANRRRSSIARAMFNALQDIDGSRRSSGRCF